ncbi:MAG: anti-sigma factor antagonist [Candidatus Omnitrophica bacterium]|nr:anti-sigma factor antagonist [Candidatus Omnitrophota bacterium]
MEIRARQFNAVIILDLSGKIDVNAANFVEAVGQCIRDGYMDILCNFEEVDFIDYMGISVIVIAYKEVLNNHGRMKFVNVPSHFKNIFSVTGIDRVIEMYPSEEIALNSFQEDKVIENIRKMQLRRRFKRLPIDLKVELKAKFGHPPPCYKADILNLSAIGAFIFGCENFQLGDEIAMKLKLPPSGEEMEMEAKVVWLADKQIQPHFYPGMGVEFTHLPSHLQQKLIEFIERNISFLATD